MAKHNATGRSRESRHVRLYTYLTNTPAWRALSGNAVKALIYLSTWEDGGNNGELFMSTRMLAMGVGVDKKTAHRALRELQELGFIRAVELGHFQVKGGPATKWRLTWLSWPAASKPPSHEYRLWQSEHKTRGQIFPSAGGDFPQPDSSGGHSGGNNAPAVPPESRKTADFNRGKTGTHSVAIVEAVPEPSSRAIRASIQTFWNAASPDRKRALASRTGLRLEEVRRYLNDGGYLPFPKQAALKSAVGIMSAEVAMTHHSWRSDDSTLSSDDPSHTRAVAASPGGFT